MFKIKIQGEVFELMQKEKNLMEYFSDAEAIDQQNTGKQIQITTIKLKTWNTVREVLKIINYTFPDIPRVKTDNMRDVVGDDLAKFFGKLTCAQNNQIYRAAQYLKIKDLKKALTAAFATRLYIKPQLEEYRKKIAELDIKRQMTADDIKKMKDTYIFMN